MKNKKHPVSGKSTLFLYKNELDVYPVSREVYLKMWEDTRPFWDNLEDYEVKVEKFDAGKVFEDFSKEENINKQL